MASVDSKAMAFKRLMNMKVRMQRDSVWRERVFAQAEKLKTSGVATVIQNDPEFEPTSGRPVWYLPVLAVDEITKIRLCHDARV